MPSLIIHGGAWDPDFSLKQRVYSIIDQVINKGYKMLEDGCTSIDVVEFVIEELEDCPFFEAGTGSFPNSEGEVEMDAIIIDGSTLNFGALAGIQNVKNPIKVARFLMENSKYCMLAGKGASQYAQKHGFEYTSNEILARKNSGLNSEMGTVGAVALDKDYNIAAGTSTGGIAEKIPGRIGDSCIIGSGAFADNRIGGVSATGEGEPIMKLMISKTALDLMGNGTSPQNAADVSIGLLGNRFTARGGVICLSKNGIVGHSYNSDGMVFGFIDIEMNKRIHV